MAHTRGMRLEFCASLAEVQRPRNRVGQQIVNQGPKNLPLLALQVQRCDALKPLQGSIRTIPVTLWAGLRQWRGLLRPQRTSVRGGVCGRF